MGTWVLCYTTPSFHTFRCETKPDQTRPERTQPDQTQPDQTRPNQSRPDQTRPVPTRPDQNKPNQIPPNQTGPNQTRPDQTKPNHTRPDQITANQTRAKQNKEFFACPNPCTREPSLSGGVRASPPTLCPPVEPTCDWNNWDEGAAHGNLLGVRDCSVLPADRTVGDQRALGAQPRPGFSPSSSGLTDLSHLRADPDPAQGRREVGRASCQGFPAVLAQRGSGKVSTEPLSSLPFPSLLEIFFLFFSLFC